MIGVDTRVPMVMEKDLRMEKAMEKVATELMISKSSAMLLPQNLGLCPAVQIMGVPIMVLQAMV
eukprot:8238133-Karenia_brevis.AAC.1